MIKLKVIIMIIVMSVMINMYIVIKVVVIIKIKIIDRDDQHGHCDLALLQSLLVRERKGRWL